MAIHEEYVRDRYEDTHEARIDAEVQLTWHMEEGDGIGEIVPALAHMALTRSVAAFWEGSVDELDRGGGDPVEAVAAARARARHRLMCESIPQVASPFGQGFAVARLEGARAFLRDTAHLREITDRHRSRDDTRNASRAGR